MGDEAAQAHVAGAAAAAAADDCDLKSVCAFNVGLHKLVYICYAGATNAVANVRARSAKNADRFARPTTTGYHTGTGSDTHAQEAYARARF